MPDFLEKILDATRDSVEIKKARLPLKEIRREVQPKRTGRFTDALSDPGVALIAEIKRASPSQGDIRPGISVAELAAEYEAAGAAAISVLTEESYFKGSLEDLREARRVVGLPLLRKDFIVDPYQIWEAAGAGADAVLLITAALSDKQLSSLMDEAGEAGLDSLIEVHNEVELERALVLGPQAIGVNNRDLHTFRVDLDTTLRLAVSIPEGIIVVAESGIRTAGDVSRLAEAGVDAVLVGEVLMRSSSASKKIQELISF